MATNTRRHTRAAAAHGDDAVKTLSRDATAAGREVIDGVRDQVREAFDAGRGQIDDLAECARDSIRAKPFRSLAIAVGTGLMLGLVMRITRRWR